MSFDKHQIFSILLDKNPLETLFTNIYYQKLSILLTNQPLAKCIRHFQYYFYLTHNWNSNPVIKLISFHNNY